MPMDLDTSTSALSLVAAVPQSGPFALSPCCKDSALTLSSSVLNSSNPSTPYSVFRIKDLLGYGMQIRQQPQNGRGALAKSARV